ncbi:DUF29 family protein [Mycetohabitans sp. B46]|uniref:DUF29 family protein n=1 Tax=Mycetohabitans sp. B46 TaxID=2772536 RepID=UPI00307F4E17
MTGSTIKKQRRAIKIVLRKTLSLKNSLIDPEWITGVWADSVSKAAKETGLDVFPEICPWSMKQVLDPTFFLINHGSQHTADKMRRSSGSSCEVRPPSIIACYLTPPHCLQAQVLLHYL